MPKKSGGSKGGGADAKKEKKTTQQKVGDQAPALLAALVVLTSVYANTNGPARSTDTFGLPNKNKSAKMQQYVKQVEQSVNKSSGKAQKQQEEKKKAKEAAEQAKSEIMPATIKQAKVPEGMQPDEVVCEFWRHGCCAKGSKCKFAHDFNVQQRRLERQQKNKESSENEADTEREQRMLHKEGPDLYTDYRDKQPGESGTSATASTDKICTHFLQAVESGFYGWRWQCPNEKAGERCKYKHCLPVGYRLQSDIKALAAEEKEKSKSVEDDIEEKRSAVNNATPVTEEVFMQWYKRKREERDRKKREELEERKKTGRLTGREIIQSGAIIADDENAQSKAEQQQEISHMRAQEEEDEQTADINDIYKDGNDTNVASAEDEHNENAAESRLRSDTQSNDS